MMERTQVNLGACWIVVMDEVEKTLKPILDDTNPIPTATLYKNMFDVLKTAQTGHPISHIHYAGYNPTGTKSIDDLTFASLTAAERNSRVLWALARESSGMTEAQRLMKRARQKVKHKLRKG